MLERFEQTLTQSMYSPAMLAMCVLCLVAVAGSLAARDYRAAKAFTAMALLFGGIYLWLQPASVGVMGMVVTVLAVIGLLYLTVRGRQFDYVSRRRA